LIFIAGDAAEIASKAFWAIATFLSVDHSANKAAALDSGVLAPLMKVAVNSSGFSTETRLFVRHALTRLLCAASDAELETRFDCMRSAADFFRSKFFMDSIAMIQERLDAGEDPFAISSQLSASFRAVAQQELEEEAQQRAARKRFFPLWACYKYFYK
jgi:hypothetical protein